MKNIKITWENEGQLFNRLTILNKKKLLCKTGFQGKKKEKKSYIKSKCLCKMSSLKFPRINSLEISLFAIFL